MSAVLILAAIALCTVSGVPALAGARGSRQASLASAALLVAGSAIGLAGVAFGLASPAVSVDAPWSLPGAAFHLRVDALSAFFAAPVFLIAGCGAIFGHRYRPAGTSRASYLRVFYGVLTGGLALVMTAQNTILFLFAWEIVALASYFLVAADDEHAEVRAASWLYLVASHVATLALFGMFALLHATTGSWEWTALPAGHAGSSAARAILWLALIGFGSKAGLMPFHVWLPGAHAGAPSHVSAIMSGVVIKMGVYGLVRTTSLFEPAPSWFGVVLLAAGIVSSILGVAFALAQHDLKRLLAYHSIENIGIIVTGLGAGVVAQASGHGAIAFLAYAGALLHVWNHGVFKALLFLTAGSVIHEAGTREIDRMGGLARRMPWTAAGFLTGAIAISGLPPLNGFVSEWLVYLASFAGANGAAAASSSLSLVIVAPALAMTGALALACFVKAFGAVFLGNARTHDASVAHEVPRSMIAATAPLAAVCVVIGLLPRTVSSALDAAVGAASGIRGSVAQPLASLQPIAIAIAAVAAVAIAALRLRTSGARVEVTWDCGYAQPTARMQYTSSSFARSIIAFFAWAMPPVVHAPKALPLFPTDAALETHVPDTVLDRVILPLAQRAGRLAAVARRVQSGRMQTYLVYIAAVLVVLLVWSTR